MIIQSSKLILPVLFFKTEILQDKKAAMFPLGHLSWLYGVRDSAVAGKRINNNMIVFILFHLAFLKIWFFNNLEYNRIL